MKFLFKIAVIIHLITAAAAPGAAEDYYIPENAVFVLPQISGVKANWVFLPPDPEIYDMPLFQCFDIDEKGIPWYGYEQRMVACPQNNMVFFIDQPYEHFAWLSNGEFIVCTDTDLGYLTKDKEKIKKFIMKFKPVISLPYKDFRIFTGEKNTIYLVGNNPRSNNDEVYLLKAVKGKEVLKKLFTSRVKIASVAGNGEKTYVAMGRSIVKIISGQKELQKIFVHPTDLITELAFSSNSGLFYATGFSVGFVGSKKNFEFGQYPDCRIRIRNGKLYILLGETYGVLRIQGIRKFKNF